MKRLFYILNYLLWNNLEIESFIKTWNKMENETEILNFAKILAKSMKNITKIKITKKKCKFFKRKTLTIMSTSELPLNYVYIATCVHTIAVK